MIKQQQALLTTEGVDLNFTEDAIHEISRVAAEVNASIDNIGARRLHTVLERIVEEISFNAPERVCCWLTLLHGDFGASLADTFEGCSLQQLMYIPSL